MKNNQLPVILIASLRRTGSTVISEALTKIPYCYIFQEPYLAFGYFFYSKYDQKQFRKYGKDLREIKARLTAASSANGVLNFSETCLPELYDVVEQIGFKEIRLKNWRLYKETFPQLRVLITGRDPRDIYISLKERYLRGVADWKGAFNAQSVSDDLLREFNRQLEIYDECPCMLIKYEDFCSSELLMQDILSFTEVNSKCASVVGDSISASGVRRTEHEIHGGKITSRRSERWKKEKNAELLQEAHEVFDRMPEYSKFWGYF